MTKAVIFDLDGTLLNTIDDLSNSVNYVLKKHNYPTFSVEEYKYKVGNGMKKLIERALPKSEKSEEKVEEILAEFMVYYSEHKTDNTAPYKDIETLLITLKQKGIKTAVLTNKAHESAKPLISKYFPELFDVVCGQKQGVPTKPDPTSVFEVMKELDVSADECLYLGDSGVDMQTAENANIFAIGVLWGFRKADELEQNGAKAIIKQPLELLSFIKE